MFLVSHSFAPYDVLPDQLVFGKHDPENRMTYGGNQNPHLLWGDVPPGTESFVLLCVDEDVPSRGDDVNKPGKEVPIDLPRVSFYHWAIANLPKDLREIKEGSHSNGVVVGGKPYGESPDGGIQGINDFTKWYTGDPKMAGLYAGYDGAGPPWNDRRMHGYRFQIFAIDVKELDLPHHFRGQDLRRAMEGHIIDQAELIGLFSTHPELLK